jgi:cytochrome c oxidase subunit I
MRGGWVAFQTPMLFTIGCVVTLAMGGLISFLMANPAADRTLHDTYYVVWHLHYLFSLAVVFGFFATWYYLFPKITSYAYSNLLGSIHFWLLFIGVNIVLVPQIFLFARMWERLADAPDGFRYWNLVSWIGSYISAASTLVFILNMVLSLLRRRPAD